ncbi:MAG TPA: hypothetical protein EYN67_01880 [Flavobacteriales bacterium]|nr:hypothetical protein [Flavobacteriales bacterium]
MNVGDLVRYKPADDLPVASIELGIVTIIGDACLDYGGAKHCHILWFTCNNEGWWNIKNLEVVSGTASS